MVPSWAEYFAAVRPVCVSRESARDHQKEQHFYLDVRLYRTNHILWHMPSHALLQAPDASLPRLLLLI